MSRPAVFLDRDGTLIVEREYLADPAGVEFTPGAVDALRRLQQHGFALVLITNQSGIGRGYYSLEDFHAVQERIDARLAAAGVQLDGVYYCPHRPEEGCACRKPALGLFRQAAAELDLALAGSFYVGDRLKDVEPAAVLGGRGLLVRTGYGEAQAGSAPPDLEVVADLGEASARILQG